MRAILVGILLLLGGLVARADGLSDAEKSAEALMQQYQQKIDSPEAVDKNLMTPLTTDTQMQTFDGKQQFSAKIQPQAGQELLKLTIQPLPSGDVKILSISQNLKFSGKLDSYMQPNLIVSGVCANGFIRCDPGSWNNCQAMEWTTDNQQLATQKVPLSSLGGCYCINNSCGTGLAWSNLNEVLSHLGGGAVGAIVKRQPLYSVGAPKISDTTVTYYGQDNGDSRTVNLTQLPNMAEPQRALGYAANPQKMEDDKASQAKNDPTWQLIKESQANEAPQSFVSCRADRIIKVDAPNPEDIIRKVGGGGNFSITGNNTFKISLGDFSEKRGWQTMYQDSMTLQVIKPDRIVYGRLNYARFDDWLQILANDSPIWSGPYNNWWDPVHRPPGKGELGRTWTQSTQADFTQHLKNPGPFRFRYRLEVTDIGCGYIDGFIGIDTTDRLLPDQIINGCTAYENDKSYLLVDETIDGVNTFKNYVKTGLRPVAQTRTINGPHTSFKVTRDWFLKERRYLHKNKNPQKYEFDFDRINYVQKHSTEKQYHDQYRKNGQVISSQGDLFLTDAKPYDACTPSCKTKKARPQHDVAGDYHVTGEKQRDPVTYDFFYRPCKNGVCQVGPGETVVKECQCLEEFGEAAAMMQVLRMAGNDLICSSGDKKTLGSTPQPKRNQPSTSPNWVCGKEQDSDGGIARLQPCLSGEGNQMFCPVDAVPCAGEDYEVEEEKSVDAIRIIPGRWEKKRRFLGLFGRNREWVPEQRITEQKNITVRIPKKRYSCPLGARYACIKTTGNTMPMCTPHQCINLATEQAVETEVIDGGTLDNDGRRNAKGECLDQLYLFNGASGYCRTPGVDTAFKDCCKNRGKVVSDNTGAPSEVRMVGKALPTLFKAGKAAYTAYNASTAATIAAKAQAGAAAAKGTLVVGIDPTTIAISIVIGIAIDYFTKACAEADMNIALSHGSGFCIEVGEYCKKKFPIVGCVQRAKSFCCFNSKMARIIQEQGRRQLKSFGGFGTAEKPECRGLTPEEFQSLDFSQIDLSEYFGDLHRTLMPEMQRNMETKMHDYLQQTHH